MSITWIRFVYLYIFLSNIMAKKAVDVDEEESEETTIKPEGGTFIILKP